MRNKQTYFHTYVMFVNFITQQYVVVNHNTDGNLDENEFDTRGVESWKDQVETGASRLLTGSFNVKGTLHLFFVWLDESNYQIRLKTTRLIAVY